MTLTSLTLSIFAYLLMMSRKRLEQRLQKERLHGILRLGLPHRDRIRFTPGDRRSHRRCRRRHQRDVAFRQAGGTEHRHQVVVRRRVRWHDDALSLQVGKAADAR